MAEHPDAKARANIKRHLDTLFGVEVLPRFKTDRRIIGGVVVKVGDRIMDGSIRHRLQSLRRSLLRSQTG
jgi:F-type H+-transporting ATPase subunit delta